MFTSVKYVLRSVLFTKPHTYLCWCQGISQNMFVVYYFCLQIYKKRETWVQISSLLTSYFERFMAKLFKYSVLIATQTKSGYKGASRVQEQWNKNRNRKQQWTVERKESKGRQKTTAKLPQEKDTWLTLLTWFACSGPCADSRALMRPSDISNKKPVTLSKEWLPWISGSGMTGLDLAALMLGEM